MRFKDRTTLLALLGQLDEEAFAWVVLALLPQSSRHGATVQVWPDGLGGFRDRATIEAIRAEALTYADLPPPPPANTKLKKGVG